MYSVVLGEACPTLDVVRSRLADRGVDSRPFFHPIHTLPPYATGQRLPVAEHLASHGLSLPSGTGLGEAEVERVALALAEALEG
jgi:perosamine synthetase